MYHIYEFKGLVTVATHAMRRFNVVDNFNMCCISVIMKN